MANFLFRPVSVIYDGHCGFCTRTVRWMAKLDALKRIHWFDSHDEKAVAGRFPALKPADLDQAMFLVADGEPPHRGFFAFRRLLWASPWLLIFIPIFYFPGASLVGPRVYAWVAANRYAFGCNSESCELHAPKKLK